MAIFVLGALFRAMIGPCALAAPVAAEVILQPLAVGDVGGAHVAALDLLDRRRG